MSTYQTTLCHHKLHALIRLHIVITIHVLILSLLTVPTKKKSPNYIILTDIIVTQGYFELCKLQNLS